MTGRLGNSNIAPVTGPLVDQLASSVINQLAGEPGEGRQRRIEIASKTLYLAALDKKPFVHRRLCEEMLALRTNDPEVLEHCISEAARHLGEDWLEDETDFASVSRASARLFGFSKEIGEEWDNFRKPVHSRAVLLVTFGREDHLIGPTLLAQRLRRKGHSVSFMSNAPAAEVGARLAQGGFDCLMVSSASQVGLENVGASIRNIRLMDNKKVPVVLGGAALEFSGDLANAVGADLVTNDEDMALRVLTGSVEITGTGATG